jgi:hypothetical protein
MGGEKGGIENGPIYPEKAGNFVKSGHFFAKKRGKLPHFLRFFKN